MPFYMLALLFKDVNLKEYSLSTNRLILIFRLKGFRFPYLNPYSSEVKLKILLNGIYFFV